VDNIGQRLREERQFRGWSQRDLARETGVNTDTISGIETGAHEPRPSTLRKLAEGLGIEVRDLFMEPALPKAEAPMPGLEDIPETLDSLLEQRGVPTRHLANENLYNTLKRASLEDAARIAEEMYTEIEAIGPDLTRLRNQFLHNSRAARLLNDAAMRYWIVRLSLAAKRDQEFEAIAPEVNEAMQHLKEAEPALVGVD